MGESEKRQEEMIRESVFCNAREISERQIHLNNMNSF